MLVPEGFRHPSLDDAVRECPRCGTGEEDIVNGPVNASNRDQRSDPCRRSGDLIDDEHRVGGRHRLCPRERGRGSLRQKNKDRAAHVHPCRDRAVPLENRGEPPWMGREAGRGTPLLLVAGYRQCADLGLGAGVEAEIDGRLGPARVEACPGLHEGSDRLARECPDLQLQPRAVEHDRRGASVMAGRPQGERQPTRRMAQQHEATAAALLRAVSHLGQRRTDVCVVMGEVGDESRRLTRAQASPVFA